MRCQLNGKKRKSLKKALLSGEMLCFRAFHFYVASYTRLNAERYWHENCINTGGFSQAHRTIKKKIGAGQREAKEKKEDKMIWTEGNQP
jgi:hypothetical protein